MLDSNITCTVDNELPSIPPVSEEEAKKALLRWVRKHYCYNKRAARHLQITNLETTRVFRYILETFTESRETSPAQEPYTGQPVDTAENGNPPDTWDIPVSPSVCFHHDEEDVEVPHTASVKTCVHCNKGKHRCDSCSGKGTVYCSTCEGLGRNPDYIPHDSSIYVDQKEQCITCDGNRKIKCDCCNGDGTCACDVCEATGKLKHFTQLTVTWENHVDDAIVEDSDLDLDENLIRRVRGDVVYQETKSKVEPLNHFPDTRIKTTSLRVIQRQPCPKGKILKQRHKLFVVPVTQCTYLWNHMEYDLQLYGREHKVVAPFFPNSCCCTCTCEIL